MTESDRPTRAHVRQDVQGLRAVAVAAVVLYHSGLPVPGGYLGVDVFFVVSGFVITMLLLRELSATGRLRLGAFYTRRFRRLIPALSLMIVVTLVASSLVLSPLGPQQTAAVTGLAAVALCANLAVALRSGGYFDPGADTNPLLHTWSLSVEEQFYLVFPLALLAAWGLAARRRASAGSGLDGARRTAATVVAGGTVLSLALAVAGAVTSPPVPGLGFYSPVSRAWEFGVGALLALLPPAVGRLRPAARGWVAAGAATLVGVTFLVAAGEGGARLVATAGVVAGTAVLIAVGATPTSSVSRVLASRPLVAVGDRSYSIYLWHWPFIVLSTVLWPAHPWVPAAAATASLAPALWSYRWVEQPLRRRPAPTGSRAGVLVAAVLVPPIAVAFGLALTSQQLLQDNGIRVFAASASPAAAAADGCDVDAVRFCEWGAGASGRPVYLVGDSYAGHFSDGVRDAAAGLGRPLFTTMSYSCPVVPGLSVGSGTAGASCRSRNDTLMTELTDRRQPGTVVLAASDTYWTDPRWAVGGAGDTATSATTEKLRLFRGSVAEATRRLEAAGHDVVLVDSVPLHPDFDPSTCSVATIRTGACADEVTVARAALTQGRQREALREVVASAGGTLVDPWTQLCDPDGVCRTTRDGVPLYRNWSHISVAASRMLAPAFAQALGE